MSSHDGITCEFTQRSLHVPFRAYTRGTELVWIHIMTFTSRSISRRPPLNVTDTITTVQPGRHGIHRRACENVGEKAHTCTQQTGLPHESIRHHPGWTEWVHTNIQTKGETSIQQTPTHPWGGGGHYRQRVVRQFQPHGEGPKRSDTQRCADKIFSWQTEC